MNEHLRHDEPKKRNTGLWTCVVFVIAIWVLFLITAGTKIHF